MPYQLLRCAIHPSSDIFLTVRCTVVLGQFGARDNSQQRQAAVLRVEGLKNGICEFQLGTASGQSYCCGSSRRPLPGARRGVGKSSTLGSAMNGSKTTFPYAGKALTFLPCRSDWQGGTLSTARNAARLLKQFSVRTESSGSPSSPAGRVSASARCTGYSPR